MKQLVRTRKNGTPRFSHVAMRTGPDFGAQTERESQIAASVYEDQRKRMTPIPQWVSRVAFDMLDSVKRCGGAWLKDGDPTSDAFRGLLELAGRR